MLDALYWDTWYNKKPTNGNERSILYVNRLLGAPRLRQLRVRNDSCTIPEEFKRAISDCYSVYSSNNEATQSYGVYDGTAWNYNSAEKLGGSNYWGTLAWYGKGGFYVDLGVNRSKTEEILMELKLYRWIDQATRAVFLDFTVYNANVNLFCVVRLVFEFPPTGGMIPSWNFETSKLIRYTSTNDFFIAGLEVIFVIFTLYYFVEELQEASINCIVFNIYRTFTVGYLLQGLLANPQNFPDFHGLSFGQIMFNYAVAVTIFLSWIRVFKYMSFNKTMMQLSLTLSRGAKDLFGFAVMFSIVFLAYAQLGYLMFGSQLIDFCSISSSMYCLLEDPVK
ncbi:polycystin-2-like protein 1 [Tachypleus tridentatus]|uniref:polycystin-2-like protein 1 n=1 Tax=Tachypleus tridentatus TaxID=6853 RepID=UPI003FD31D0A